MPETVTVGSDSSTGADPRDRGPRGEQREEGEAAATEERADADRGAAALGVAPPADGPRRLGQAAVEQSNSSNSALIPTDRPAPSPRHGPLRLAAGSNAAAAPEPHGATHVGPDPPAYGRGLRALRLACWGAALLLAAFDAWFPRFSMSFVGPFPDAVAYLDIAAACARGAWGHLLNAYWSPLYPGLLAVAFRLLHPSAAAEFPVVHGVNLLIFAAALASFDFLWRVWFEDHRAGTAAAGRSGWISLPPWALLLIGYALFTWSSICWISVQGMGPDLLVAAVYYFAAGLTLRLRRGDDQPGTALLLGAALGLGFLAKAVMLPLSLLFLLVAFLPVRPARRTALLLLAAGVAFLIVIAPFVYGLSRQQGRLTFGDTGRLNYAWWVNGVQQFNWQGQPPGHGTPRHPTRLVYPAPPVYEFAGPIGGTYPIWTDPSYWTEGIRVRFNWQQQTHALLKNLTAGRRQLPLKGPSLLAVLLLVLLLVAGMAVKKRLPPQVRWDLLLLALAPGALYALVVVESRYLGASVVLMGLAFLPAVRLPAGARSTRMAAIVTGLILLIPAHGLARVGARAVARRKASSADWETATALQSLGLRPGDRVGCIGLSGNVGWARLARVTVAAELPTDQAPRYWTAKAAVRAAVLRAFAHAGVRAVVAGQPPATATAGGWRHLGATDRYVHLLGRVSGEGFTRRHPAPAPVALPPQQTAADNSSEEPSD